MADETDIALNPNDLDVFFKGYFGYYNTLDNDYKNLFVTRCIEFISGKEIYGREGFVPDNRVKAIVAASAVQLTLGLETWHLAYFDTIELHPSDFHNTASGLKFSGETNLEGVVKLSWKKFMKGYEISNDNLNLGLHEFTHAMRFSGIRGGEQDYFLENYFDNWLASADEAFRDLRENRESIFRNYGGSNINEFVSVCIEHFFESPEEIKQSYPLLYHSTAILLNQRRQGQKTEIGIRYDELMQKNKLLPGLNGYRFEKPFLQNNMFGSAFFFALFLLVYFNWGINILALLLAGVSFLFMGINDFRHRVFVMEGKNFTILKGRFFSGSQRKESFPVSHLISVREPEAHLSEVVYYNSKDGYFYSEKLSLHLTHKGGFVQELHNNKVAVFI